MYQTKNMKLYKLEIYRSNHTDQIKVQAEAHTFDNGMIIFWTRNSSQEWAMVSAYPSAMTAIVYYDEITPEISTDEFIEAVPDIPSMGTKKRSKK